MILLRLLATNPVYLNITICPMVVITCIINAHCVPFKLLDVPGAYRFDQVSLTIFTEMEKAILIETCE